MILGGERRSGSGSGGPRPAGTSTTKAPRCDMSGLVQSVDREEWIASETGTCLGCGRTVRISVRATDLFPWARVKPHRTDGTPCR